MVQLQALIEQLNNRTIAEMKAMRKPHEDIVDVMRATLILLEGEGVDMGKLQDWTPIKVMLGKTGKLSIKRRILEHSLETVTESVWRLAKSEMKKIEHVDAISKKSAGAAVFFAWNTGVLDEIEGEKGFTM